MAERGLVRELCRVFASSRRAMLCALGHGQVTVDGKVMRPEYDLRWPPHQLRGRMARLHDRHARLYGGFRPILHEDESPPLHREAVVYEPEQMDIAARISEERPRLFDDVPLHDLPRS